MAEEPRDGGMALDQEYIQSRLLPVDSPRRPVLAHPGFENAAVLFLLLAHPPPRSYDLVLFRRTRNANDRHSGEISFPGGRREPQDTNLVDTAVRECEEELGIPRVSISVLGSFEDYASPKRFIITPVVGFVRAPQMMHKNDDEVDKILQIPITFFISKDHYSDTIYELDGQKLAVARYEYACPDGNKHVIWGATGHLIARYVELVYGITLMTPSARRATPADFVRLYKR